MPEESHSSELLKVFVAALRYAGFCKTVEYLNDEREKLQRKTRKHRKETAVLEKFVHGFHKELNASSLLQRTFLQAQPEDDEFQTCCESVQVARKLELASRKSPTSDVRNSSKASKKSLNCSSSGYQTSGAKCRKPGNDELQQVNVGDDAKSKKPSRKKDASKGKKCKVEKSRAKNCVPFESGSTAASSSESSCSSSSQAHPIRSSLHKPVAVQAGSKGATKTNIKGNKISRSSASSSISPHTERQAVLPRTTSVSLSSSSSESSTSSSSESDSSSDMPRRTEEKAATQRPRALSEGTRAIEKSSPPRQSLSSSSSSSSVSSSSGSSSSSSAATPVTPVEQPRFESVQLSKSSLSTNVCSNFPSSPATCPASARSADHGSNAASGGGTLTWKTSRIAVHAHEQNAGLQRVNSAPGLRSQDAADHSRKRRRSSSDFSKAQNVPFKRVKEESVLFKDDRLRDNSFLSKGDTFGVRAYHDLRATRGKGFRKAMTKKKRQNHHGGTLDPNNVSSFKFSDDSD